MTIQELIAAKKAKIESSYEERIASIDAQAAAFKAEAESVKNANLANIAEVELAVEVYGKLREDEGYDKGQADAGVPADDKKYTEEDLQAELKLKEEQVAAGFLLQIDALTLSLSEVQNKVTELEQSTDLKVEEAIESFKAEAYAKLQEQQVIENQSESAFADFMKPKTV